VIQRSRFSFFREAQIWYSRDPEQYPISDQFENVIALSDEFYREIVAHPIPADLEAVKVLAGAPAVVDLFMWLSYRCFLAKGQGGWVGVRGGSTLWPIRAGHADRIDRIRKTTPFPRKARKVAGVNSGALAGVPGKSQQRWDKSRCGSRPRCVS
jgi:Plasmid encoded RepA protein